jgi:3-deoxy-D-manno-octulosonate 8-phosphate phosphatase (KDO 8-P phosphatase)
MGNIHARELLAVAERIKLLILDVDGVLTDGTIILDNTENELKCFHVRDGHGLVMLANAGVRIAVITGRYSVVIERRARELGIKDVFQKCLDKRIAYRHLAEKYSLSDEEIAYIGDDVVDIPVLAICGLPVAVADADDEVKAFAKMVTSKRGGRGAVREVADFILKAKGVWKDIIDGYANA